MARPTTTSGAPPRRRRRLLRPLDRYVFGEFFRIFLVTALGFPVLLILIDLTDHLDEYLARKLPVGQVALSYVYWLPETMFLVLPAAVLFATVFAIGGFTRHSEITAAKASGISFYRLTLPIFLGATLAAALGLALGELAPITSTRRSELLGEREQTLQTRANFVHAADAGVVYKVGFLNPRTGRMDRVEIERHGVGPDYPTLVFTAQDGRWRDSVGAWTLRRGALHVIPDSVTDHVFQFDSAYAPGLTATPVELTEVPRDPQDLGYQALGRYIAALERAGGDANELRVERALKLAIPVTCIIIVLFGAPLATSTQRGGAAYGIGISLATTVLFLILIQLTKAIGGNGLVQPELAAWLPSVLFGTIGLLLLARVRT
ncbi:MAG TPA: LptF/LptG family permease [Gemmatimonadaceae bacterium]|nr:LptF/LptG family permease [Gemmatimonadaceae bacterium]